MNAPRTHRLTLHPGDKLDVQLVEPWENGYPNDIGGLTIEWQERDRPPGEIATQGRELHITVSRDPRVGPLEVRHP